MLTGPGVKFSLFFFRFFLIYSILIFITGCSSSRFTKNSTLTNNTDNSLAIDSTVSEISASDLIDSTGFINEMINTARSFCEKQQFSQADSILKITIETIILYNSDSANYETSLNEILSIYSNLMPPEFPIPDDISVLAYTQTMLRSLDSMSFSQQDSTFMQKLLCGKSTNYNVPIIWNERVLHAVYYYHKNRKSTMDHWISRSNMYLPIMKKLFEEHSLPQDLAYLPLIESGFNPKAYSHAHASGIWQFIPSTGKVYGLRNNYWIDERRDPIKSTIAAIKYLKKLHNDFNDWHLALAAYNCGEGGLKRAISRSNTRNYWELNLPKETMNYVPLYLAALTIAKNPNCFNLQTPSDTATFLFDTVKISECLDLKDIAIGLGISFDTLRKMNPHILHWCTPPDMSNVYLYLPSGYSHAFNNFVANIPDSQKVKWYRYRIKNGDNISTIANRFKVPVEPIKSINRLKNNKIIAGKYLFIPIPVTRTTSDYGSIERNVSNKPSSNDAIPQNSEKTIYQVKPGDSVWGISEIFGVTPEQVCSWNKLNSEAGIRAGQILTIYKPDASSKKINSKKKIDIPSGFTQYKVKQGDTPLSIARQFGMKIDELTQLNNLDDKKPVIYFNDILVVKEQKASPAKSSSEVTKTSQNGYSKYQVSAGETLFGISKIFSITIEELRAANGLDRSSLIKAGDTLLIPSSLCNKSLSQEQFNIVFYEVKRGDNLWRIADIFGISVQSLYEFNDLSSDSVLMPGDTIKVIRTGEM